MRSCKLLCFALLIILFCITAVASELEVKVDSGTVRGIESDGIVAFKGIPFAAPPVGNLRWKAPQPVSPWTGVRSATEFGHDCAQVPFAADPAPSSATFDEDCLVLNVWAPSGNAAAKLPVMVWIYGGGWVNGGSSPPVYDGTQFARQGVILVSFNYRLGRFGYFAHPALIAEAGSNPVGNYGYMDQIAALKWVQQNIAAFGGDPKKVTIFGESAGGGSVLVLMTSPMARDLFQQAIVESAPARDTYGKLPQLQGKSGFLGKPSAEACGLAFAKSKGITGTDAAALESLRKLPAEQVVDGLNMMTIFQQAKTFCGGMIDGKIIVETPQEAFTAGHQMKIPVMVGTTNRDMGFNLAKTMQEVFAPFGFNAFKAYAAYDPKHTNDVAVVGQAVASDRYMVEPARFMARAVSSSGQPAYEYRFSYVATSMRAEMDGASHAAELPYVFDTVKAKYGAQATESDLAMGGNMNAYWVSFAKTGDPNGGQRPKWPPFTTQSDVLMDFTNSGPVAYPDPWKSRLDVTEKVASK